MPLRGYHKVLNSLNHALKKIRLALASFKKYYKLTIDADVFRQVKSHEMFIAAIQLSRITNSLVSVTRIYTKIPDNGRLINAKDKLEILLIYGSVVYEALLEFGRLSKSLKALHAWQSRRQDIGLLNKEKGDKNSMFRKVLHAVRNEVTFHFEKAAIVSAISRLEVTGDVEFAYGETSENFDVVYGLVDNLILRYLQTTEGSAISIPAFYQKYMDYVGDLSTRIIDVSSDFLTEILGGIAKKSRTPLAL